MGRDKAIEDILIGSWHWAHKSKECSHSGNVTFKGNGEYTRIVESCVLADDEFGKYHYGWYVANQHICFVSSKDQYRNRENIGFDRQYCNWKVLTYNRRSVEVADPWWTKGETFMLQREDL